MAAVPSIVAECPACHTRFRVTVGQLKLADGQVRCGNCLKVFDARPPAPEPEAEPQIAPYNPQPEIDFGDIELDPDNPAASTSVTLASTPVSAESEPASIKAKPPSAEPAPPQPVAPSVRAAVKPQAKAAQTGPLVVPIPVPSATGTSASGTASANNRLLDSLRAEPVQMHMPHPEPDHSGTTFGWLLGCLFALLLLAGQYLWFERQTLAWQPPYDAFYRLVCAEFGCQLPRRQAIEQIHSQRLVIQPHPKYLDALQVELILENQAAFEQPYPALQLSFSDLKGRLVAQRRFQPNEYLDLGRVDPSAMPAGQPVQLLLEIMKPGVRAVNYQLTLVKPDAVLK
ncbi:DUF3426 domain-containing protein [Marinobacterium arenosum]|uniref:DUF3426 domain-containing protein n=1 Tax=Marinobacterium arenosum TaxID=2862496 RepID=UPI001C94173E|nr:DUF3426 domain-containing protein [Marinobacterium arenosum]MBY4679052.1 DUF3426 domain-containing protein [Marinobacterium arenosum]